MSIVSASPQNEHNGEGTRPDLRASSFRELAGTKRKPTSHPARVPCGISSTRSRARQPRGLASQARTLDEPSELLLTGRSHGRRFDRRGTVNCRRFGTVYGQQGWRRWRRRWWHDHPPHSAGRRYSRRRRRAVRNRNSGRCQARNYGRGV
ncbi:uncharacterized protein LOC119458905 isoform X1 [Dermacentor silvarum]|uniref:uncharacterized protein LOC119458905 isoform X1 n=1 Tax=Dermacentor silvarum TaxID=543639 RepID=UPI0021014188|nr:uncharacterized protein LOC119458905 isoform X1 [Dermacentor silvarum]